MIHNIQTLYDQLEDKKKFIQKCSEEFGNTPNSLANHWFSRFWSIPEEHQGRVVEILQNTIKAQNELV